MAKADFAKLVASYRVTDGRRFRLKDHDPGDTGGLDIAKSHAKERLEQGKERLSEMQERLYAQDRWSLLLIFQAMDAAGKDSAIKHVMSGINPQGCQVSAFKAPSEEELDHDFLWRCTRRLPERGRIGIFNRSHYEELLVVRVHPEMLKRQRLPRGLAGRDVWRNRFEDVRNYERYLARNGTAIIKFFLNISKAEQKKRFLERLDEPEKHWKFSPGDVEERKLWPKYMRAYEDVIRETSAPHAPWYVVPADDKWFARLIVAGAIVDRLERIAPTFPVPDRTRRKELARSRAELLDE